MTSEPSPGPAPGSPPDADGTPPASGAVDERRLHPAATIIHAIHHVRAAAFALVALIASQGLVTGVAIAAAFMLAATAVAFVHWRTTQYGVTGHTLRLRSGVFARKEQNIPASRISAVDTSRGVLQRIFGVVEVQVQTAGGKKKAELVLRAVSLAEAERLRRELGHRATAPASSEAPSDARSPELPSSAASPGGPTFTNPQLVDPGGAVVFAMSPRGLLVGALTSPSIAVVGAATAAGYSALSDLLPNGIRRAITGAARDLTLTTALELALIVVAVATVISVTGTVLLYAGFQITQDERRLRVRRGLLTEHVATVPIDRIHGLRVVESPVRQLLGYAAIEVEVAGYANESEATRTLVPFVRRAEVPALVDRLVPGLRWPTEPLHPVPRRAVRRYLTIPLLISLVPVAFIAVSPLGAARFVAVLFPIAALAVARAGARDAGWHVDGDTLTLRRRHFGRSTLLARASRLQQVAARTSPWQRRADLATFTVRLSNARSGCVRHVDGRVAEQLLGVVER